MSSKFWIDFIFIAIMMKTFEVIYSVESGKGIFYTIANIDSLDEMNRNNSNIICQKLIRHQQPLCKSHTELIPSVVRGLRLAVQECQHQFSNNHWNCSGYNITLPSNKKKGRGKTILDNLIMKGTAESGYLNAIISAGVAYQVTLACSRGQHRYCGCDKTVYDMPLEGNYKWSGCSENIHFGAAFSKRFLDTPHKKRLRKNPTLGLVSLHNSHSGRKVVVDNMGVKCKCHGVSGSCEVKTCYRALPSLRIIGDILKKRFTASIFVELKDLKLISKENVKKNVLEDELTYVERSPNFCVRNPRYGSLGTSGRLCNITKNEDGKYSEGSCDNLCCGRGYRKTEYMKEENCHCQFIWCCNVTCETCMVKAVEAICN
uniref:Protein Wnt n=1 Tax=Dendrocoelum lacteum TaxID=27895 RepID=T1DBK0_9PLAT